MPVTSPVRAGGGVEAVERHQSWALRTHKCDFVPGLLQAEAYARELHVASSAPSSDDTERMIAVRMERQELLKPALPPDLWVIVQEWVLRHTCGRQRCDARTDFMTEPTQLPWRKSSYSNGSGGNCIEIATPDRVVAVRDSKDPAGPVLRFTPRAWRCFVAGVRG